MLSQSDPHMLSRDLLPTEQLDLSLTGSAFTMTFDDVEGYS